MQAVILEEVMPTPIVSNEWIAQELRLKTSITKKDAEKIANDIQNELAGIGCSLITNNLFKSIVCLKLEEHNLLEVEEEFLRTKMCYDSFEPSDTIEV